MKRSARTAPSPDVKRCAVYTRKSTSAGLEQEFNSLHAQREACVSYIERQPGWKLVPDQYDDGGFTGANIDRPAFQRLLADAEAGQIDVIVVYKVDRLSRSLLDFVKVMERLHAVGAAFVSVTQNFSTADAMGRLTLNMLMSFAEFEREMIAERTRDKIAASRRKGKWTGGPTPFGYYLKDKKLAVNEAEAAIVREAFRLHLQHGQMASVAKELTARALLPRSPRKCKPSRPLRWTVEAIGRLLDNPLYAGFITSGDERFPGEHVALIDDKSWQASQQLLAERTRDRQCHRVNHDYVLRGLLRCGRCKAAMCPGSTRKGARVHRYYRCSTRDKYGRAACNAAPMGAAAIESYVVERVSEIAGIETFAAASYGKLSMMLKDRIALLKSQQQSLAVRLGEVGARSSKLADEWVNAEPAVRDVLGQRLSAASVELKQCEAGLADVRAQLRAADGRRFDLDWATRALRNFPTVWDAMSTANRGRLLRALIEQIVVDEPNGKIDIQLARLDEDVTAEQGEAAE